MTEQSVPSFTWQNPTKVIFGAGKLANLPSIVQDVAGTDCHVFLVTGSHSLRGRGILQQVIESLGVAKVTLFDEVTPFPSPDLVDTALEACRNSPSDVVVAVGGGSAMDLAKCVAILMTHDGKSTEFATRAKTLVRQGLPFIAVPTTSGSSSEVTSGAALWDMTAKRSMSLSSPLMFPTVALVDPQLTMSMSKALAAVSGMDAFTSAFESYWSLDSEPLADAIDLEVIKMFAENLERSCIQGDLESRAACALAATMSGIAYSNSHPNVCHAVGSPLTLNWGTEHGQAVGVTLKTFLRWCAPAISHKLPALWKALGVDDLDQATSRIDQIMRRCGLRTNLGGLGVKKEEMDTLVDNIRWDRLHVLPKALDRQSASELLSEIL